MSSFIPSVGSWLYASCSAQFYGEVIAVGEDANGQATIDIRIEDPNDLVECRSIDIDAVAGPDDWVNPLTSMELPEGVKAILRHVQWRFRPYGGNDPPLIECNTPGDGCCRCTKLFSVHTPEQYAVHWTREP